MTKTCSSCGKSLGTYQQDLSSAPEKCVECQTKDRISMMLGALPEEQDWEWERLSEFEQKFLSSVRRQFKAKGTLKDKHYQALERIWEKMNK